MKRRQKTGFLSPRSSKITLAKEKERRERKREEKEWRRRKKAVVALLVFIIVTLKIIFGRKILLDAKGPFGNNVIKNLVRYTFGQISVPIKT